MYFNNIIVNAALLVIKHEKIMRISNKKRRNKKTTD